MSAFISGKRAALILCAALFAATGTALLLTHWCAEPRLGRIYDFFLARRTAPPLAGEILVIETDEIVEPGDVVNSIMTLSELEASTLLIEVPVLGTGLGRTESDDEIRRRFNDEYALLGSNIRNLFEAIRVGSVPPGETAGFVENLVELAERGKERLTAAVIRQDEAGASQSARAEAVFGAVWQAADLAREHTPAQETEEREPARPPLFRGFTRPAPETQWFQAAAGALLRSRDNGVWYSRPGLDHDGVLRRAAPFRIAGTQPHTPDAPSPDNAALPAPPETPDTPPPDNAALSTPPETPDAAPADNAALSTPPQTADSTTSPAPAPPAEPPPLILEPVAEHIVYRSLQNRRQESRLEYAGRGPVLVIRGRGNETLRFPLDRGGSILLERPGAGNGFRRLSISLFREYDAAGRDMRRLLKDAENLGAYSETRPERIPLILCDYAAELREILLREGGADNLAAWRAARAEYMASLDEFLFGPAEMTLASGYDEIIATEKLNEAGISKLQTLRDELIRSFVAMRETHRRLVELRSRLASALDGSFCIMGPPEGETGAVESSALLANALLTGRSITPGQTRYTLLWSLIAVYLILAGIHLLRPGLLLAAGISACALTFAGFGWSFILSSYWIDPLIPAASCLSGVLVMFTARLSLIRSGARRFRLAYGPAAGKPILTQLIKTGSPPPGGIITVRAAIIAVKNPGLLSREDRGEQPRQAAEEAAAFRAAVSRDFKKAGAVIIGSEGDTMLTCFGSPLERIYLGQIKSETRYGDQQNAHSSHHPAVKAAGFIIELVRHIPGEWSFGIDSGDCAFSWTPQTGYIANGRPVVRARVLSALAPRYQTRVLITRAVSERIDQPVRKLSALKQGENASEDFYELVL
jgi:hypothetical protein